MKKTRNRHADKAGQPEIAAAATVATAAEDPAAAVADATGNAAESTADAAGQTAAGAAESTDSPEETVSAEAVEEPQEEPGDEAPSGDAPDLEEQLREAEQRGYLRGRNERIEELMRQPAPYARQPSPASAREQLPDDDGSATVEDSPMILSRRRISIWDL